jgi:hypothetical protein
MFQRVENSNPRTAAEPTQNFKKYLLTMLTSTPFQIATGRNRKAVKPYDFLSAFPIEQTSDKSIKLDFYDFWTL